VVVEDHAFAADLHSRFATGHHINHGVREPQSLLGRTAGQRFKDWLAYALMRLALVLTGRKYRRVFWVPLWFY
jgi:cardiolipin synthase